MAVLCSNCSGKLIFNPATQKLECANCGSFFSPEDVRDLNADLHSKYYDTRVYICGHCGAEVVTSDSEASTFCVYCGNPAIVFSRISKEYKPDGIIPFQVTKEDAIRYVKLRFLKNPMVPKEVKEKLTPGNIRGIYVPYWIINAAFSETDMLSGEVKNGKRTEKRWYARAGEVKLKNVPVDGSKILNDDISMKLEPFYLEDTKVFDEDYLNGFYSNTSDTSYNELRTSAAERCHKLYAGDVVKDIPAKNVKIEDSIYWVDIQDDPIYIMMPVWFFTFKYDGKPYTILINGQTGKVVGTMPWKQKSLYMITGGLTVLTLAVMSLLFVALKYNFFGLSTFYNHAIIGLMSFASFVLTRGITGIVRIFKNLKLTQSEDIFKYVKKRQE